MQDTYRQLLTLTGCLETVDRLTVIDEWQTFVVSARVTGIGRPLALNWSMAETCLAMKSPKHCSLEGSGDKEVHKSVECLFECSSECSYLSAQKGES